MKRILHISDLHVTKAEFINKGVVKTHFDDDANFTTKFIKSVNSNCGDRNIDKIIITGDIANMSEEQEYKTTQKFLEDISIGLKVKKEDFLILPGNHDINWSLCEGHYNLYKGEAQIKKAVISKEPFEFNEKYQYFSAFYEEFYEKSKFFDPSSAIVWHEVFDDLRLIIIGLNTNEKECHLAEYHYGYITHKTLKNELDILINKYQDYKFVVFSHHIIASTNELNQCIKNHTEIFNLINNTYEISTFFCGHQHVGGGRYTKEDYANEFFAFGVGSLAKLELKVQNSYCLLDFTQNDNTYTLKKAEVDFTPKGIQHQWGLPTISAYDIYKKNEAEEIPVTAGKNIIGTKIQKEKKLSHLKVYSSSPRLFEYSKKIVQIIRENGYLKSGHFHWSPKSRTLGAINTSAMFSNFHHLSLCKSAIIDLIHENQLTPDLIVGLGMEGSLLSANISTIIGSKSSYCPYIIRNDHHLSQETKLDFKGVKKVALITDVAHKGYTVNDLLIDKKEIFKDVKEIYLISIFYTSKTLDYKPDVFTKFDKRIKLYTVCDEIKIEDCSYCDEIFENCKLKIQNFKCKTCQKSFNNCTIYSENLETVFKYY